MKERSTEESDVNKEGPRALFLQIKPINCFLLFLPPSFLCVCVCVVCVCCEMSVIIAEEPLEGLTLLSRGKVRDVYEVDEHSLLFVASDRISAYDVIMKNVKPFF